MGAGAERTAGVDHDLLDSASLRRLLPGRPHVDAPRHEHRVVEAFPALVPVVRHLLGEHLDELIAGMRLELAQFRELPRSAVDGVLDDPLASIRCSDLLDAARRDLEQLRQHRVGLIRAAAQREPDHALNACLMRSKKPSWPFCAR